MTSVLDCPHCHEHDGSQRALTPAYGQLQEAVCASCDGRFLSREQVEDLVVHKMGVDVGLLRQLTELYPGHSLTCPECQRAMNLLLLRGVYVDLCLSCGGLWFDAGELTQFTLGLVEELSPEETAPAEQTEHQPSTDLVEEFKEKAGFALQEFLNIIQNKREPTFEPSQQAHGTSEKKMQKGEFGLYLHEPSLTESDVEAALRDFSNYTEYDFTFLATNHHGLLLDEIDQSDLKLVQSRLKKKNLDTAIVSEQRLALPLAKKLSGGQIVENGIEFKDAFARSFVVPWDRFLVLSISDVLRIKQKAFNKDLIAWYGGGRNHSPFGVGSARATEPVYERKDERATHLFVRLFEYLTLEGQRGHLEAHQEYAESDTAILRSEVPSHGSEIFIELAQASLAAKQASPHVMLNPGVQCLAEGNSKSVPLFRSRRFYERSLKWLYWKAKQSIDPDH